MLRPARSLGTIATTLALLTSAAFAEDIGNKLASYEQEARNLGTDLPKPNERSAAQSSHRLVDAQVAFQLGDYDQAALILFDLSAKSVGPEKETATYYLGEALFQKGDRGAARTYFVDVAQIPTSRYYQLSLVRLVEIAIVQKDWQDAQDSLAKLTAIGSGQQASAVPYVTGKLAFAQAKYDDALAAFAQVAKGSDYELQALYYAGATNVAKKDLAKATDIYTDLISRHPRTAADRRVIELAQLALGRLYYEREQPSKSIDSYLLVDRHSDLFPDALYETAWVYVKSKQYDKALRALELLEQSDPQSQKTPTTRILEGNLRIRKAQAIRLSQVNGTIATGDTSDPATEYDKAAKIFADTHDLYLPSYTTLAALVDGNLDAASFVEQIAGRSSHVFMTAAPIPDAAAQWLRDQPEVQRVVGVETDLGEIYSNIVESETIINRLEGVLATGDRTTVYPKLASRRHRIAAIQDDLVRVRSDLADQEASLVASSADLAQATATRKQLAQQYTAMGDPEKAYADRVSQTRSSYEQIDNSLNEVSATLDSTEAMAVAMRTYALTGHVDPPTIDAVKTTLDAGATEAQQIEDELTAIRNEVALGKDLAGVGDEGIAAARALRAQLKTAQDNEQRMLDGFASASRDRGRSQNLAALADRAASLAANLDGTDQAIDRSVGQGLDEVKVLLAAEKQNLETYKQELDSDEQDARSVGAQVLAASFKDVKAKLYDVVIRTDVGTVDVSWSQRQDNDDDLKRLNLARSRELKQLHDEFKDVLEDQTKKPSAPRKSDLPPATSEGQQSTSPDKAGANTDQRVKPIGDQPTSPATPSVKPDEQKKTPAPKKGGAK
ncbi:MAG: tetratricopeptide repeat protein [Deltaproteobacteria bacterium]